MEMIVHRISTSQEWNTLSREWDELLRNSHNSNFFLSWTWLTTWWKHFGQGELVILVAQACGELLGLAPLMIRRSRRLPICKVLSFIGRDYGFPAHLGFIAAKGREAEVNQAFCKWITQNKSKWDIIAFERMAAISLTPAYIAKNFNCLNENWRAESKMLALPNDWKGFRFIKPKLAKRLRQYHRRLKKEGEVKILFAGKDISSAEATSSLISLHMEKWGASSKAFASNTHISFNRDLISRLENNCLLFVVSLNGKHIAAKLDYIFVDTLYCNQGGYSRDYEKFNLGSICLDIAAEEATRRGLNYYDFLAGEAEYKDRWSTTSRTLTSCISPRCNLIGMSYRVGKNIQQVIQDRRKNVSA